MLRDLYQQVEYDREAGREISDELKATIREKLGPVLRLHHRAGHGLTLRTVHHGVVTTTIERVITLAEAGDLKTRVYVVLENDKHIDITGNLSAIDRLRSHNGDVEFRFTPA